MNPTPEIIAALILGCWGTLFLIGAALAIFWAVLDGLAGELRPNSPYATAIPVTSLLSAGCFYLAVAVLRSAGLVP